MNECSHPSAVSLDPLILKLLAKRAIAEDAAVDRFLNAGLADLEDPFAMKGMEEAVARVRLAGERRETVLIHGDYDIDGIAGTAILAKTLHVLGIRFLTFLPDRNADGYGVSSTAVARACAGNAALLITVDCGISAHAEIESARRQGIDVLVIDHHRISEAGIPNANIVINPLRGDCGYPFKELSAGGLAFKLSQALLGTEAHRFLDWAALATIGDVAPLVGENRILVKEGLRRLSARRNMPLRVLAETAGIKSREINTGHVGFILGPRINAAGRMSSPEIALQLLLTENEREALSLAKILNEENKVRQREEKEVLDGAVSEVERSFHFSRERVIVVGREGWHPGVVGIVASRLVERYHRPAIVIAFEGEAGKGSGRSIEGFHLFEALENCRECFREFGGHELAAGLTIERDRLDDFRKKINDHARDRVAAETFVKKNRVDLEVRLDDLTPRFLRELKLLEPHGSGNPRPVFLSRPVKVRIGLRQGEFGTRKFWVTFAGGAGVFEVQVRPSVFEDLPVLEPGRLLELVYNIKVRTWNGMDTVVLEAKDVKGFSNSPNENPQG
jgi:single-stranded-DNA-specific exonuclease